MSNSEYMKEYMLRRYHKRMEDAKNKLGNKCAKCGAANELEIDHIDPTQKTFTLGGKGWNIKKELFDKEVDKCQLLCKDCHNDKTIKETGKKHAKGYHGTLSSYRYCKCDLCRKVKSDHSRVKRLERIALQKMRLKPQ